MVQVSRYTSRLWSSESGDHKRVSLEIHSEAVMKRIWRYTSRLWPCEFGDALEGRDGANLEAVIEQVWRYSWWLWSSEFGDTLGGHDQAMFGGVLGGSPSGGCSSGGRRDRSWDSIHWLTCNCANVKNAVQHHMLRDEILARGGRQSILGWCSVRCMLYSVLTLDYGMER